MSERPTSQHRGYVKLQPLEKEDGADDEHTPSIGA